MDIINITSENKDTWKSLLEADTPLAPDQEWFMGYGVVSDGKPAGVIIGQKLEKGTAKRPRTKYTILYFYVAEEYRKQGIGSALFRHFLENSPYKEDLLCDVPTKEEELIAFLSKRGIDFSEESYVTAFTTVGELGNTPFFKEKSEPIEGLTFFEDIDPWEMKQHFPWIEKYLLFKHTIDYKEYDERLSLLIFSGKKATGFYIVRRQPFGRLDPESMQTTGGADMVMRMLKAINEKALAIEDHDTPLRIVAGTRERAKLFNLFLPGGETTEIRFGLLKRPIDGE